MKEPNTADPPICSDHTVHPKETLLPSDSSSKSQEIDLSALLGVFIIVMALLFVICLYFIGNYSIIWALIAFFAFGVLFSILFLWYAGVCLKLKRK